MLLSEECAERGLDTGWGKIGAELPNNRMLGISSTGSIETHTLTHVQTTPHSGSPLPSASSPLTLPRAVPGPDPQPDVMGDSKTLEMQREEFGLAVAFY